jgi:hypothetical protein
MKKLFVLLVVALQMVSVTKAQEKMVVERTNGSTTEYNVEEVSRVYFKSDVALNCRLLPNFFVAFTDGLATNWTVEDNVFLSYAMLFTKTQYDSFQGNEDAIIAEVLNNSTGKSYDGYVSWWIGREAATDYVLCTVSYNNEGKRGQLVVYPFKTLSTGLPVAELSNITIANYGNDYWKFDVTLKNGAVSYYYFGTINENLYYENEHYIAWACKYYFTTEEYKTSDASWLIQRDGNYLTFLTWGVDAYGNIGDYSYSSWSATTQSPAKANGNKNGDRSQGMVKFDESHLKSLKIIKMEK